MLRATKPAQPAFAWEKWAPDLGALAVCVYIAGLALPVRSNLWLIVLAAGGLWTILFNRLNQPFHGVPLLIPVLIFLAATALSTMRSEDPGRSLRLSAPLLPALLIFLVIAEHFQGLRHTRLLYLSLSAAGLVISLEVVWSAWQKGWAIPPGWQNWMSDLRSPLLVVPNDTVFLAVVAPLSLALLFCADKAGKVLPAVSIFLSIVAVCLIRSRIATLTIIASLVAAAAFVRPRLAIAWGLAATAVAALLDGSLGFPLAGKAALLWHQGDFLYGRIPIWSAAWTAFIGSPLFGHGPHTFDYASPASIHLRWAHNLYLEILCEQGIIGIVAFAFLLYQVFSVTRTNHHGNLPEVRYLRAGAHAAWIGFSLGAVFELTFLREWVVTIFFVLLGLTAHLSWYNQQQENNT